MTRYHDIGPWFLQLLLLASLTQTIPTRAAAVRSAVLTEMASVTGGAQLDACASKRPRCATVRLAATGLWWLEVSTTRASTTPSLLVMDAHGGDGPRVIERVEVMLLEVSRPGEYVVCVTSAAPLGDLVVSQAFTKGGDPLETELDPNPVLGCPDPAPVETKGGDPLETELDPNP